MQPGYVFIVGLPRTGTTLIQSILNCSQEVAIAGETHFFDSPRRLGIFTRPGYRRKFAQVGNIATEAGARQVVDYIYGTRKKNFWDKIAQTVDREEFLQQLSASDRSERALLDLAMACYAQGKPIRGEKTPAHIYAVPTLLEWFPNAKVIHTMRDPRAVYVSNKKKYETRALPWYSLILRKAGLMFEFYSSLDVMFTWFRVLRLHRRYQRLYPDRYYLSRYEDLIANPKTSLQKLCDFVGIDFTDEMLQQTVINSSFLPRGQVQGFNASTLERWREHLHPLVNRWFVWWCGRRLLEFGYQL